MVAEGQIADRPFFVAIAGNIGSGKTTLTQKLSEKLGCRPHYEAVSDNPYLKDFYEDMSRWSFPLQIYFLTHRFNTHRLIESSSYNEIQDRSIYEDAIIFARSLFEQGLMSERDYENYLTLYHSMVNFLSPPSLMIFLKRSVPKLMDRIRLRARDCEKNLSIDYLQRLNHYYEDWFLHYDQGPSLLLETDGVDFLHNQEDFDGLVMKVQAALALPPSTGKVSLSPNKVYV